MARCVHTLYLLYLGQPRVCRLEVEYFGRYKIMNTNVQMRRNCGY